MDLSIVVPTHNQADLLSECLRALQHQTLDPHAYEIVVVDDGSTDRTPAVLANLRGPVPAQVIRFPANRGRSAARNAGITHARGPLIVFVDSDVIVREDFLDSHLRTHRTRGPRVLSRGPVVLVSDPAVVRSGRIPRLATSPAYLDTANAGLEKQVLLEAGLFDEGFRGYGWEDFELGMRLKRLGVRRAFCRKAVAFHVYPPILWEALDRLLQKETERAQSALYFFHKHPTLETRLLIQATLFHRALYWIQAGCGYLTPANIVSVTRSLRHVGFNALAYLALRGVLNRHYLGTLEAELKRDATAVA